MKLAILTIGDELLNGDLSDTNTTSIALLLGRHSFRIRESVSVGDCDEDIAANLQRLAHTHDVVIVTGGLGPTEDDRTARAAAKAFGRSLSLNDEALRQIRARFVDWGRPMHPGNEKQALLPSRSTVLQNTQGTAPGFRMTVEGKTTLFFFPGVPSEMLPMLEAYTLPFLQNIEPNPTPEARRLFTVFGVAEPDVEARLSKASLPEGITVAFAVPFPYVQVKLRARGDAAEHLIDQAELAARKALGDFIIGFNDETLPETTTRLLTAAELTLALAESCTGGMIAQQITDQPGASIILERGAVSYANSAKRDWLGVSEKILNGPGAVSAECALAMARGVMMTANTRIGLAVTGIAGPSGGTPEKPVGTVFMAMVTEGEQQVKQFQFPGNRHQVRLRTTCTALDWLRRLALCHLEKTATNPPLRQPFEKPS